MAGFVADTCNVKSLPIQVCVKWYSMNEAMPARCQPGRTAINDTYASLWPTSGTRNAHPTTSFL